MDSEYISEDITINLSMTSNSPFYSYCLYWQIMMILMVLFITAKVIAKAECYMRDKLWPQTQVAEQITDSIENCRKRQQILKKHIAELEQLNEKLEQHISACELMVMNNKLEEENMLLLQQKVSQNKMKQLEQQQREQLQEQPNELAQPEQAEQLDHQEELQELEQQVQLQHRVYQEPQEQLLREQLQLLEEIEELKQLQQIEQLKQLEELEQQVKLLQVDNQTQLQQLQQLERQEQLEQLEQNELNSQEQRKQELLDQLEPQKQLELQAQLQQAKQQTLNEKLEQAEQLEQTKHQEQLEQLVQIEQPKQQEQSEQPEQLEQTKHQEQLEQLVQLVQIEQPKQQEQSEQPEQLEQPKHQEQLELTEQTEQTEQPQIVKNELLQPTSKYQELNQPIKLVKETIMLWELPVDNTNLNSAIKMETEKEDNSLDDLADGIDEKTDMELAQGIAQNYQKYLQAIVNPPTKINSGMKPFAFILSTNEESQDNADDTNNPQLEIVTE